MIIYHYNSIGYYCGFGFAEKSPLEDNVFLIPAYATDIKPPEFQEGKLIRFVNGEWILEDIIIDIPVEEKPVTEIINPMIDQDTADIWGAMLALSAEIELLKGGS